MSATSSPTTTAVPLSKCSGKWPAWGSISTTGWSERARPECLTNGLGSSSLLPTLTAFLKKDLHDAPNRQGGASLGPTVRLLPTPTAQAAKHGSTPDVHANGYGSNLWDVPHLLPTPRAQNGETRNMNLWVRPDGQPQNLENALARVAGETSGPQ